MTTLVNGHPVEHPFTIPHLVEALALQHRDKVALVDGDRRQTFEGLRDRSARLAAGLASLGIGRGDVVALWLPSSIEAVEYMVAGGYLGATVLGVNTKLRSHDVLTTLEDSGARAVVTAPGFKGIDFLGMLDEVAAALPASLEHVVCVGDATAVPQSLASRSREHESLFGQAGAGIDAEPDLPAQAFSSSGTTSSPKLVLQSHRALVHHAYAVATRFGYLAPDTVVLGALPFCGVFGYNTLFAALAAGRPLVIQAVFDAAATVELVRRHAVTHTNLSDEMLRRILDAAPLESMPTWRETGFGSFTAIDAGAIVDAAASAGRKFFQTFGSSEVLAVMTYPAPESGPDRWRLGGGVPVSPEISVRVRDVETGEIAADTAVGEIEVRGPNVTCGYLNREGNDDLADDGFFRTGDLGYMQGEDVVYLSRRGDALRLGGFLVNPQEIEDFLEQQPSVKEAQVVGVDTDRGAAVVGFVVAEPPGVDEQEILARCRQELAGFKVPRRVVVLEEFPVSQGANGMKIQRTKLRAIAEAMLAGSGAP
ncbi:AMP-binding protein [Nocardioides pakistanensis]